MTISYNWLVEYLPATQAGLTETIDPEKLSKILTAIGLEVESLERYESIKGGLQGLVIGKVLTCEQHPNADKLKITTVDIGKEAALQIVCGAANVAVGQHVVVATVGTTIYPTVGEPITMKVAKIRGVESYGMICAEDEIGIGANHDGILVLDETVAIGTAAVDFFKPYTDFIYEIGLTPNRMDAMSHLGVAKDVCAYLTHHYNKDAKVKQPFNNSFKVDNQQLNINVTVENKDACLRYSGVSISGVTVQESPKWLKDKLIAIGQRPINNIVDITNFILHETGQPLHAFDADAIINQHVIVKNVAAGTSFVTLDEKERKLLASDLLICNGNAEPMCIAGVFGGATSGVKQTTKNIFLESACFEATSIRKTSLAHGLRTDAATRFEKGVDISNTVQVLKRAALLIKEIAGGEISSDIVDVYPTVKEKTEVSVKYHYIKKLSGKNYHPDAVKKILTALGFEVLKEGIDELKVAVPFNKPDISLPADIVEEIVRIDGLDNIAIPTSITISPAIDTLGIKDVLKDKIANYLVGLGFNEIFTNSITNSNYFDEATLVNTVKMVNNLSVELDVLRPSILETGLECIAYNSNRKNTNLQLFEFGKTYHTTAVGNYAEEEHLALYITGNHQEDHWKEKAKSFDFYRAKGLAAAIVKLAGLTSVQMQLLENDELQITSNQTVVATVTQVQSNKLKAFDIKQPVYFIDVAYNKLTELVAAQKITYKEVSKFPAVQRDLALIVNKQITFDAIEKTVQQLKLKKLQSIRLFDVFESEKLGADKKSMAINFTFLDEEKTLVDKEVDAMMQQLIVAFEKNVGAEIRR